MKLNQISIRQMKGVSAQKEQELHAFGIHTIADLLDYFPFRYEDYRVRGLRKLKAGRKGLYKERLLAIQSYRESEKPKTINL